MKNLKRLVIAGSLLATLVLLAAGGVLLYLSPAEAGNTFLTVPLIVLSPSPLVVSLILLRALARYEREAERFATRDPLTGLYNQSAFWDLLTYETERAKRQGYKFSLLLIDIDNFKTINDLYGHDVGDAFLREFSALLTSAVRKGDIPARYGGDNFTAILPICDEEQAYVVARRIMEGLYALPVRRPDGTTIRQTVSIGIAVFPSHGTDARDLFLLADSMLAKAKQDGKDRLSVPSDEDSLTLLRHHGETNILIMKALDDTREKIVPYFQAIMDPVTRKIEAYEVLTRIVTPDVVIPAADFIEAAENMGVIGRIDYRLIERAFVRVRERGYSGRLFLNLSPKALVIREFMPTVRRLLDDYGIDPSTMVFEITERDAVKNVSLMEQFIRDLKDDGFRFAVDDFGAGYSSFQYIKTFSVDYLKIDGEFIRTMGGTDRTERVIVSSIAGLAANLGITTIAECVETQEILDDVAAAGINLAQGYYLHRPAPDLA